MEYRKKRLDKEGKTEQANKYLLNDPNDQSSYLSVQNFSNNTICPCQESTYNFLEEVVSQMQLMYKEANVPFSSLHLGADEVAQGVWENSPLCQEKVGQDSIRSRVKSYYLKRLTALGEKYRVALIFWEDIAGHQVEDKQWAKENLSIHSWSTAWGEGNEDHAYKAANAGYSTILVPVSNLYFDQSYNKNSGETGFYWGSYVNTFSAFSFLPMNMFKMDQLTKRGHQLDKNYFDSKENLTAQGSKNIRGLEGSLFAETIKNKTDLEYLLFPKLLGLAERAWAPSFVTATDTRQSAAKKTQARWLVFANLLGQRELPRLAKNNLAYRIDPVGFMINNGLLTCNTTFPGSTIMLIKTDGSIIEYKKSIAVKDIQSVYSQNALGRKSKVVDVK